jgi:hypothetical protein
MNPALTDLVGYAAAGLVLATFCMRDMVALRWMAIASNVAFMAYGGLADLGPVLVLHLLLLPVNVLRLAGAGRPPPSETQASPPPRRSRRRYPRSKRSTASPSNTAHESTMRHTQGDGHGLPGREGFSR